ncbi:hypothetical protein [Lyngbya confervoides]|nr:hypothetical protein [Lyngbya confervoides]
MLIFLVLISLVFLTGISLKTLAMLFPESLSEEQDNALEQRP